MYFIYRNKETNEVDFLESDFLNIGFRRIIENNSELIGVTDFLYVAESLKETLKESE